MKKLTIDWNYWIVRFIFVLAVIVGFKAISNFHLFTDGVKNMLSVLSPFIIGFIVAYLLSGPQKKIQQLISKFEIPFIQKKSRGLSILILYVVALLFIFLTLNYVVPLIIKNLMDLLNLLPSFYAYLTDLANSLEDNGIIELIKLEELLKSVTASYSPEKLISQGTASLASIGLFAKSISSMVLNTFLAFIISIYVLIFKDAIATFFTQFFKKFLSETTFNRTKRFIQHSNDIFYKFIACQFLDACILGVLATLLLSVLGVRFSITLGILLGLCNMIPYFGSIFASIVTMIITFFTGGLNLALVTVVSLLILQQIDGNIIGPRIMGGALNLNPILIIVSITVGGAYFGILGMFLSVPVAAILKIIVMEWLETPKKNDTDLLSAE
ncbi:AI-2E family transporter [uncultured Vagococcus sp.]|uniref:AI-2E family transporter n=1 Tax=uncultured Vagococcus sp. TaxID=189676 RepID=UPI0028D16EDF|nr:AI-2E family transporter [uncultured Vagococcus sp.]